MSALAPILCIDADHGARDLLVRAFSDRSVPGGLTCLSSASNALLYLNQLGPFRAVPLPRLIIFDINLPRSEGGDFLQMLNTNTRFRTIPRCMLTKAIAADQLERSRHLVIQRYHIKPVTDADARLFAQEVGHWLGHP